jgi:GH18 family chitinase
MDDYADGMIGAESQNQEYFMQQPSGNFLYSSNNQQSSKYDAFFVVPAGQNKMVNTFTYRVSSPHQQLVQMRPAIADYSTGVEYDEYAMSGESQSEKRIDFSRSGQQNVLCYMTNWAFYRKGDGQFVPEHLDASLCSHIIYSFASLEPDTLTIKEFDPWADIDNGLYKRTVSKNTPVLLALGGWTDSVGNKYSQLAASSSARQKFVRSTVDFLRRHGFAGLHFDWNYPVCWQSDCKKGPKTDKPNFTKLIQELGAELSKQNPPMLLGVAISGYKEVITEAYDIPVLSSTADFLTVMTYDYHGAWESQTGHVSPLYGGANDKYPQYNTDYTMVSGGFNTVVLAFGSHKTGVSRTLEKTQKWP